MLLTGLEEGGLFPWVVFIFNHIPLEKKKIKSERILRQCQGEE